MIKTDKRRLKVNNRWLIFQSQSRLSPINLTDIKKNVREKSKIIKKLNETTSALTERSKFLQLISKGNILAEIAHSSTVWKRIVMKIRIN